jgi:26S proteasome regulatory subunit T2
MGIRPPKGVILYGAPGTGKTLLAKAVANQTSATFLRVVGSELIQKYLGDGPKLVRNIFDVAKQYAPSIVFIDEVDAIGSKRYDSTSSGEREIQRTLLELLNQLDGFDDRGDVKVIMATNRIENLDPALIRPGRIDRKILFENPDQITRKKIFSIHTSKMSMGEDAEEVLEELVSSKGTPLLHAMRLMVQMNFREQISEPSVQKPDYLHYGKEECELLERISELRGIMF